jgi:hypothetical protein
VEPPQPEVERAAAHFCSADLGKAVGADNFERTERIIQITFL